MRIEIGTILIGLFAMLFVLSTALLIGALIKLHHYRQKLEHANQLVAEKQRNPTIISHEIRTPLTVIYGSAQLLADEMAGPLNARQAELVNRIQTNSMVVHSMAEDFLVEAQLDARLFNLRIHKVDLRSLAREVVRELRTVHAQDAELHLDVHGRPLWVEGDRLLLRQALTNLINNAVTHSATHAQVWIRVVENDDEAILEVTDNGSGMTFDERKDLFTPFVSGRTRKPGAGMGMMITQKIAAIHGGRILVDTISSKGTTFLFMLPYRFHDPLTAAESAPAHSASPVSISARKESEWHSRH
ncbi:MAG: HAMP domain-containing sensor histidine kinase [Arcanobacterium sp.]|nr:HAMP domain-containing sensor histidine kinase [Arcanobacterium sp.]